METGSGSEAEPASISKKSCFVVSEFGADDASRIERKQALKHLVKKVLEPMGYEVKRADDIDDLGQITHQIIERLLDDDLVVADLTGLNPNVFYELAVRHAIRKPVVTLMTHGQTIPFDLKDVRTVFYDLRDPDKLEYAQNELEQKVLAIEASDEEVRNPITAARNVRLFQQSDDPQLNVAAEVMSAINDLRDEVVRSNRANEFSGRSWGSDAWPQSKIRERIIKHFSTTTDPFTFSELAQILSIPPEIMEGQLRHLVESGDYEIYRLNDGRFSSIPF